MAGDDQRDSAGLLYLPGEKKSRTLRLDVDEVGPPFDQFLDQRISDGKAHAHIRRIAGIKRRDQVSIPIAVRVPVFRHGQDLHVMSQMHKPCIYGKHRRRDARQ